MCRLSAWQKTGLAAWIALAAARPADADLYVPNLPDTARLVSEEKLLLSDSGTPEADDPSSPEKPADVAIKMKY